MINRRELFATVAGLAATPLVAQEPIPEKPLKFVENDSFIRTYRKLPEGVWHPFHNRKDIEKIRPNCYYVTWQNWQNWHRASVVLDFVLCAGDTLKEKYESLYGMMECVRQILYERNMVKYWGKDNPNNYLDPNMRNSLANGEIVYPFAFSLLTSPEVASIFETASSFIPDYHQQYDNGNIIRTGDFELAPMDLYKDITLKPTDDNCRIIVRYNHSASNAVSESMFAGMNYMFIEIKNFIF